MERQTFWALIKQYGFQRIQSMIGFFMPSIMHRSLRQGLHAIWHKGNWQDLPKEGFIFASNHPSWWDMYVSWLIGQKLSQPMSGIFRDETLKIFPFFRSIGGIGQNEVREALRRIKQGHILQVFPSGDIQQSGLRNSYEGFAFLAEKSKAPVYPVALRVLMRGAQKPEVFVVLGEKLEFKNTREEFIQELELSVNSLLEQLDGQLKNTHPEAKPDGFESWLEPQLRFDQKIAKFKKLWLPYR